MALGQGVRELRCIHCSKSFSRSSILTNHLRTHTGERPFHCSYVGCLKKFVSSDDRRKHEATHMQHKRFACSTCGYKFLRSDALRRHETRKHGRLATRANASATESAVLSTRPSASENGRLGGLLRPPSYPPEKLSELLNQSSPTFLSLKEYGASAVTENSIPNDHTLREAIRRHVISWKSLMAKCQYPSWWYRRAWFIAAEEGNVDALQYIFDEYRVPVDIRRDESIEYPTPVCALDLVSKYGHVDALLRLIRLGANVDGSFLDSSSVHHLPTPLHWATDHGVLPHFRDKCNLQRMCSLKLIENGANVDLIAGSDQRSVLMNIVQCPYSINILRRAALLTKSINARDSEGRSFVHFLASTQYGGSGLGLAHRYGADLMVTDHLGRTTLHYASLSCNYESMEWILENEQITGDFTATDVTGKAALHHLGANMAEKIQKQSAGDHFGPREQLYEFGSCLAMLLRRGADINAPDLEGKTPLRLMGERSFLDSDRICNVVRSHSPTQRMLNTVNKDGKTTLDNLLDDIYKNHPLKEIKLLKTLLRIGARSGSHLGMAH